ncbi:hypothetical protein FNYG_14653 [Fusarium nygamai]|uniref:Uncharacterized protein n=1 Tax=Gibberella nygamai TaxID=42673 RepID=A0A2K0US71_GIBNY|nr:hypothetical protein FNYG_14653 [Fusarium nygamai]
MGALERELLDKSSKYHEAVLKASQRIGIPKTTADINADSLMRTTFVRNAVNAAGINMAATALFDIKTLFDGGFQNYFLKLGITGAYGGTVSVCSSKIDPPIFGHGAVVGVVVGSVFNMASLASTGDWSRFGKNTGLSMVSSAGGWGGTAGTAFGGPIGGLLGSLVGGLGGGFAGRWGAGRWSGLGEITDAEVEKSYKTIMENCAKIGVYPDPSLSKRDIVTGILDQNTSPKAVLVRITGATAADLTNLKNSLSDWQ